MLMALALLAAIDAVPSPTVSLTLTGETDRPPVSATPRSLSDVARELREGRKAVGGFSAAESTVPRYWQMHDKLFEASPKLEVPELKGYARGIGLDAARFDTCLDSGAKAGVVLDQTLMAEQMGVDATPAFFINGQLLSGTQPLEAFKFLIDGELAARETKASAGVRTAPEGTALNALGTR